MLESELSLTGWSARRPSRSILRRPRIRTHESNRSMRSEIFGCESGRNEMGTGRAETRRRIAREKASVRQAHDLTGTDREDARHGPQRLRHGRYGRVLPVSPRGTGIFRIWLAPPPRMVRPNGYRLSTNRPDSTRARTILQGAASGPLPSSVAATVTIFKNVDPARCRCSDPRAPNPFSAGT